MSIASEQEEMREADGEPSSAARLAAAHRPTWQETGLWSTLALTFFALQGVMLYCLLHGPFWPVPLLALLLAYVMHSHLLAFHEAAHRTLCPAGWLNDACGTLIGVLSFMSLSLYRSAHRLHHAYLGTERDEELWPFVQTESPRWARRLAAFVELNAGLLYTPTLFLRTFLRRGSPIQGASVRRRIWLELLLLAGLWTTILACTVWWNLGQYVLWLYLLPAVVAGNVQSWRKYIEHVGMTGTTAVGLTRSVVPRAGWRRWLLLTLFYEPYHGVHHRYGKLPGLALPAFTAVLEPVQEREMPPYVSYWAALGDLLSCLADPQVGPQWQAQDKCQTLAFPERAAHPARKAL